jgi:hypothetical protein
MTSVPTTIDIQEVMGRLERIETILEILSRQRTVKEFYTTEEIATIMGKAPFTVREWCRQGRVVASKRDSGRGTFKEWIVSHDELMRLQSQGLLPLRSPYRHLR